MDHKNCGVAKALKIIGSKWTMLILRDLLEKERRFGELQRSLTGISPRTLSLRLDEMEKEGIVKRKLYDEVPLKVEYSLTKKGQTLNEIICKIREWGENHS